MDNQNTNQSLFSLRINENAKAQLKGAAVVAGVAAILSLTNSILSVVKAFMEKNKPAVEYQLEGFPQASVSAQRTGNVAGAIISLIIAILLFYFLNRFSTQTKTGLNANNSELVSSGIGGLSAYFVTAGILIIIVLAFTILGIAALAGNS